MCTDTLTNSVWEKAELDGSLSLMQADNSTACGFKDTQTPTHTHIMIIISLNTVLTHTEDGGSFVPSLITLQCALFSLLFLRTSGSPAAMRPCRRMTFI